MSKRIELTAETDEEREDLLHVTSEHRGEKFAVEIVDHIEARMREMNGGDQDKLLCGGCLFGLLSNLYREIIRRGEATVGEARDWSKIMRDEMAKLHDEAYVRALVEGDDAEAWVEDGFKQAGDKFVSRLKDLFKKKPKEEADVD